jgi:hypothetical protein
MSDKNRIEGGAPSYRLSPGTDPWLVVPGENRAIDPRPAEILRERVAAVASEMGFDKVTAGVVLMDYAVQLFRRNEPVYGPAACVETLQRAVYRHFGEVSLPVVAR